MNDRNLCVLTLLFSLTLLTSPAAAVDGVLNFGPEAEAPTFLKAWELPFSQSIHGVEVYENDATATAQSVALLGSRTDGTPDPGSAVALEAVGAASDGWRSYASEQALRLDGRVWIRVTYASGAADVASGAGAAIGYSRVAEPVALPQWVSADGGESFGRLDPHLNLAASLLLDGGSQVLHRQAGETAPAADPLAGRWLAAHPNPFNPRTEIAFRMESAGNARLSIYDLRGRRVTTLVDGPMPEGRHAVTWTATDASGAALASGVYLVAFEGPHGRRVQRVALVR